MTHNSNSGPLYLEQPMILDKQKTYKVIFFLFFGSNSETLWHDSIKLWYYKVSENTILCFNLQSWKCFMPQSGCHIKEGLLFVMYNGVKYGNNVQKASQTKWST